jgi:hypothetical protein
MPGGVHTGRGAGWDSIAFEIGGAVITLLLVVLVTALFPKRMETTAETILERPGWSILYGFLSLLLILPVALFLVITCIGVPLLVVELLILIIAWVAADTAMSLAIGRKLGDAVNKPIASPVLAAVIGAVAVLLVELVPYVGVVISLILSTIGLGAIWMTGFGANRNWLSDRFNRRAAPPAAPEAPAE